MQTTSQKSDILFAYAETRHELYGLSKGFWIKPRQPVTLRSFESFEYCSVLEKKLNLFRFWTSSRKYYLCQNTLVYCDLKDDTKVKGYAELDFVRCQFKVGGANRPHSILLQKNGASIELYTKSREVFDEWQQHLRPRVVLGDYKQRYVTEQQIGEGSQGKVFLVREIQETGVICTRRYAAKVLNKKDMKHRTKLLLIDEIRSQRALNHPGIVRLLEVHELEDEICLVMEAIEGGELSKQLKARGHYTESECAIMVKKLLEVLVYLAEKRIVHRDLKPENILLRDSQDLSSLVIADFGLACRAESDMLYKGCGTPGYVAPEILFKKYCGDFDKIDIFSVGCIFHKLLVGASAFYGKTSREVIKANAECVVNYEKVGFGPVSSSAKSLLQKMLEKEPLRRITAKQALDHDFFTMPTYDMEENVTRANWKLPDASEVFDPRKLREKTSFAERKLYTQTTGSVSSFSKRHLYLNSLARTTDYELSPLSGLVKSGNKQTSIGSPMCQFDENEEYGSPNDLGIEVSSEMAERLATTKGY